MRVGREISIVSSDKIARGEALDIERYAIRGERCVEVANNWPTIGAQSDAFDSKPRLLAISLVQRWPPQYHLRSHANEGYVADYITL